MTYHDDLYHCYDPTNEENIIPCDGNTHRWKLEAFDPNLRADDSDLCREIVDVLVRAKQQDEQEQQFAASGTTNNKNGNLQAGISTWESVMDSSVVDSLEPCVLWAMTYGSLAKWAPPVVSTSGQQQLELEEDSDNPESSSLSINFDPILLALVWDRGLSDPVSLDTSELRDLTGTHMLEALRAEIGSDANSNINGRNANNNNANNANAVEFLDLRVTPGLPDFDTGSLPLTLTGRVVFIDPRQALGPSSLRRVLLRSAFQSTNAMDLYLFRLRIANDPTLNEVDTVIAGREALAEFVLQNGKTSPSIYDSNSNSNNNNNNAQETTTEGESQSFIDVSDLNLDEDDEGIVSVLLVAIISAVGAAILAVVCFAYCLICRSSRTSGQAFKTLEEHSLVDIEDAMEQAPRKSLTKRALSFDYDDDGVPAVRTAPTNEMMDESEEYDIQYLTGSQVDDGISDYDMDTLPPPSTHVPTDDERSIMMSIMDGYDDEDNVVASYIHEDNSHDHEYDYNHDQENASVVSDANTSLYSYIPDDTPLTAGFVNTRKNANTNSNSNTNNNIFAAATRGNSSTNTRPETNMQKAQKKGVLWSVMDSLKKAPSMDKDADMNTNTNTNMDTDDSDKGDIYIENSSKKNKTHSPSAMLGPSSDNDSHSHDSNSLLYGTDEEDLSYTYGVAYRSKENDASYAYEESEQQQQQQQQQSRANDPSTATKKKQFEELWRDDNRAEEADEAESVVGFLESVQSARKSAEAALDTESLVQATETEGSATTTTTTNAQQTGRGNGTIVPDETTGNGDATTTNNNNNNNADEIGDDNDETNAKATDDASNESLHLEVEESPNAEDEKGQNVCLPPPTKLESYIKEGNNKSIAAVATTLSLADDCSVSSSVSGSSRQSLKNNRIAGESARTKKSSEWASSSSSLASCSGSVNSSDSSKLRSLLCQSDTNDAALLFGKQHQQQPREDSSNADDSSNASSNSTPEPDVSMSSCTSNQLKSLLTRTGDEDSSVDDEDKADDLLFKETPISESTTTNRRLAVQEEEKKDEDFDGNDRDDEDDNKMYLPAAIRPSASSSPIGAQSPGHYDSNDDSTVISSLSEAPSVDESIGSNMGWF